MSRERAGAAATVIAGLVVAGCSSTPGRDGDALLIRAVPDRVTVTTSAVRGLGTILTDGNERVLYMFPPDAGSRVSCTGPCAGTWPTLALADGV
jgi:predicted lipoprotein with Yx(FWY)xxD motif